MAIVAIAGSFSKRGHGDFLGLSFFKLVTVFVTDVNIAKGLMAMGQAGIIINLGFVCF